MTDPSDRLVVPLSALGPMAPLNKGANGTIHALQSFQLGDEPGRLVYKEYRTATTSVSLPGLLGIVRARTALPAKPRRVFESMAVWPLRVVVDDARRPTGVLMKLIPAAFMEQIHLPSGAVETVPREVQHLIFDPAAARRRQVAVPADRDLGSRLRICERLSLLMAVLHRAGLVYGDLSARNVLYTLAPAPSVLLVDCDAARVHGNAAVNKQQDSPDWDPPEAAASRRAHRSPVQTQATDCYKLALFVLRCVAPGRGSSVNRDLSAARTALDRPGMDLLRRSLEGAPEERPRARDWCFYLQARLGDRRSPVPASRPVPVAPAASAGGWRRGADGTWVPA